LNEFHSARIAESLSPGMDCDEDDPSNLGVHVVPLLEASPNIIEDSSWNVKVSKYF
jgi:hypothetical protein